VSITSGILYVVATPIGNLGDMSPRALQVLREVDWVAAEDTRHSKRLLHHFGIHTPLISLHDHNERARVPQLLKALQAGKSIALIADAGTPLISDPGFHLLRSLRAQGLKAIPIPGPSSLLAALSVAGLPTDRFVFEGFLPAKTSARRSRLETLKHEDRTLVFFEASHRIQATLGDMAMVFGEERQAVIARELTKMFEDIQGDTLMGLGKWLAADDNRCKGEFVIMVHGVVKPVGVEPFDPQTSHLLTVLLAELPVKQAVTIAARITGLKKNLLYNLALRLNNQDDSLANRPITAETAPRELAGQSLPSTGEAEESPGSTGQGAR